MFIHSLELENILSFRDTRVDLRDLNILIGSNASGKSNLMSCISLLAGAPTSLQRAISEGGVGADSWIWKGPKRTGDLARITCRFEMEGVDLEYGIGFGAGARPEIIQAEWLGRKPKGRQQRLYFNRDFTHTTLTLPGDDPVTIETPPGESFLATYRNPAEKTSITKTGIAFRQILFYRDFGTTSRDQARTGLSATGLTYPLDADGSNLALVLQGMEFHSSLPKVKRYLSRLSDRFEDIQIHVQGGQAQLYVQERGVGRISASRLSDGTLKFLCLMVVLFAPQPAPLVCIEEPEVGLHPDALVLVSEALREASERMQLIVTTHSDALVSAFSDEPESVIVCERDLNESTTLTRLSAARLKEWLEHYTLGELWKKGEIGGTRW